MSEPVLDVAQVVPQAVGGIRSHVRSLVPRLESLDVRSVVFGPDGDLLDGGAVVRVPIPARIRSTGWAAAVRVLRGDLGEARVVHAHGLKAAWVADRARGSRPLVVTVHNLPLPAADGRPRRLAERVAASVLARADRLVAPSAAVLDALPAALRVRAEVVLPVVDVATPTRSAADVRSELGVPAAAPLVVVVARLHRQKGLDVLARAWPTIRRSSSECRLVVVGDGPERAVVERTLGSLDGVLLAGARSPATDVIAAADLTLVTSRWEAVPLVLVESVVLGTPAVSTDVGAARALLGEPGLGAIVPVGDDAAVAAAVLEQLRVGVRASTPAGRRSRPEWPRSLRPEPLVERLAEIYRELA